MYLLLDPSFLPDWVEGTRLSDRHRGWVPESHLETITNSKIRQRNLSDALKLTTATAAVWAGRSEHTGGTPWVHSKGWDSQLSASNCWKLDYGHSVLQMRISVIELFTVVQQLKRCKNASQCSIGSHLFHSVEQYIAFRAKRELLRPAWKDIVTLLVQQTLYVL